MFYLVNVFKKVNRNFLNQINWWKKYLKYVYQFVLWKIIFNLIKIYFKYFALISPRIERKSI